MVRITDTCYTFPSKGDCSADPNLCYTWKSATFLLYLAAVIEGMTLVAYIAVFNGGYARRLNGWKALSLLHSLIGTIPKLSLPSPTQTQFLGRADVVGIAQLPATLLVLHNLKNAEIFALPGWRVGASLVLATVSYSLAWFAAVVVGVLGKFSPDEYTLIPNL